METADGGRPIQWRMIISKLLYIYLHFSGIGISRVWVRLWTLQICPRRQNQLSNGLWTQNFCSFVYIIEFYVCLCERARADCRWQVVPISSIIWLLLFDTLEVRFWWLIHAVSASEGSTCPFPSRIYIQVISKDDYPANISRWNKIVRGSPRLRNHSSHSKHSFAIFPFCSIRFICLVVHSNESSGRTMTHRENDANTPAMSSKRNESMSQSASKCPLVRITSYHTAIFIFNVTVLYVYIILMAFCTSIMRNTLAFVYLCISVFGYDPGVGIWFIQQKKKKNNI